ncbi:hypothetical protein IEO21_00039 [Rhodonia placenta]|uniref:Mediator of RNA polymerase II transcription subunit 5 n=1 Tax=Rhodonia placenta TaxID=104341 RepID=A0A8H7U7F8_9APHY|nr:hypothetical protein IEO21_00039 [Postia placenta]
MCSCLDSVLFLFRDYPGDPTLQVYLKQAIHDGLISLPKFVSTFLSAAKSTNLHHAATLDMLCRVALDAHYASGMPPLGSIVPYGEQINDLLATVFNSLALLRTAHALPISHFHQLTTSASELLILLLPFATDVSQMPPQLVRPCYEEVNAMLQVLRLAPAVRQDLDSFAFSLSLLLPDTQVAREAQMMHTVLSIGRGDLTGPGSDTDLVTCSLVLNGLVRPCSSSAIHGRACEFGAGDGDHIVALLVGLYRWSAWKPVVFYTQLIVSSLTCLAQSVNAGPHSTRAALIWRAFVTGRLPLLLHRFQTAVQGDSAPDTEWHGALQNAVSLVLRRSDLMQRCDNMSLQMNSDILGEKTSPPVAVEILHQLVSVGLMEISTGATLYPALFSDFHPRLPMEAQEAGMDLVPYIESKLVAESNIDDAIAFVDRCCRDPCSHAAFAKVVEKRFTSPSHSVDLESLSHTCRILCRYDLALDIVSLHVKAQVLVAHALAFIEDYDCETVGDPRTAVTHVGDVVLFVQEAIVRCNVSYPILRLGERQLSLDLIRSASTARPPLEFKGDDKQAYGAWFKALFDSSSEGIEDTILRNTRPKTLLRIAATLFAQAIIFCAERKIDRSILNNGIQFFMDPLLNWTSVGVAKSLMTEIRRRGYRAPLHLDVLQTLLLSSYCPPTVLRLSASAVLRLFPAVPKQELTRIAPFDPAPIRRAALNALGAPTEEPPRSLSQNTAWTDHSSQAIRNAFADAQAPALDVDRCLLFNSPTDFLMMLWNEILVTAARGNIETPKRIATYVLTMPRRAQSPPLLPIFLHEHVPGLVATADSFSLSEQATTGELLIAIISSALTAALHLEYALHSVCGEQQMVLGQSAAAMARRLGNDLRRKGNGATAAMIVKRLTTSQPFAGNFPTFMADL